MMGGGIASIAIPVQARGLLQKSNNVYSVTVTDSNVPWQVYYPSPAPDDGLVNNDVIIKGFYNGYKSGSNGSISYESIIVTSIEAASR